MTLHLIFTKVKRLKDATLAKVVPTPNNGSSELVRIHRSSDDETWFVFQKLKYIWDDEKKLFRGLEFPANQSYEFYLDWRGHATDEDVAKTEKHFGNNTCAYLLSLPSNCCFAKDPIFFQSGHDHSGVWRALQGESDRSLLRLPSLLCGPVVP